MTYIAKYGYSKKAASYIWIEADNTESACKIIRQMLVRRLGKKVKVFSVEECN